MTSITERFKIENEILINFEGKHFPKLQYEDNLHQELAYRLQDPELAKMIYFAYADNMMILLNADEKKKFESALCQTCFLFGCLKYPPHLGFRLALKEEDFSVDTWIDTEHYKKFMEAANQDLYPKKELKHAETLKHIVITTTSAAGGNIAVAEGLKNLLEKDYKVTVIDIEKVAEEVDPIKIATGTHTTDKIYAEFIQQKNAFNEGFEKMNMGKNLSCYIEPTLGKVLKEQIVKLNPDYIISTRNGHDIDLSLPHSLGIPGSIIHCDCELGFYYKYFIGKVNAQLFKIWLPENHARVFKPAFDRLSKDWNAIENKPWEVFKKNLAEMLQISEDTLENQIEFVGAPTKPAIKRIKDLNPIKEKWGLKEGESAVLVTLGQNGVGKMKEIFDELSIHDAHQTPIHYFFVCGSNKLLKEEFETKLKSLSQTALNRCTVLGLLPGASMNELLNISEFVIGKPGGSQKEECLKLGLPLMSVFMHEYWESGNFEKLKREGFDLPYDSGKPIAEQIEHYLNQPKPGRIQRMKWKQIIPELIKSTL